MIPYSIDNKARINVVAIITILAAIATIIIYIILENIPLAQDIKDIINNKDGGIALLWGVKIFFMYTLPSFIMWALFYWLYTTRIWRWKILQAFHHVPDLNGKWDGKVMKNNELHREVTVTIEQTWNEIMVVTEMKGSSIHSQCECTVAAVDTRKGKLSLKYAYENKTIGNNNGYIGYNELKVGKDTLHGAYITTKPSTGWFEIKRRHDNR